MDSARWILYIKFLMYKIIYKDRIELKENRVILWDGLGDYKELK